ncbi:MAG: hypothetical protein QM612_04730 [Thermomonas sp.]|uniref:hypothetical protein n=1 Tax=Thermomonas sp. TaxID=1971895 RepID=UPI0039E25F31
MSKYAQLPDGTTLEFPDGTPDDVIDKIVKAHIEGAGSTLSQPAPSPQQVPPPAPIPSSAPHRPVPLSASLESERISASVLGRSAQQKETPPGRSRLILRVLGGVLVLGVAGFLLWIWIARRDSSEIAQGSTDVAPADQIAVAQVDSSESVTHPEVAPADATTSSVVAGAEPVEDYYGVDCGAYSGAQQSACNAWQNTHVQEMEQRAAAEYDNEPSYDIERERQQLEIQRQHVELERQRNELERQRNEAEAQRRSVEAQREEAAAVAAQAERERIAREQQAAEQRPTADDLYESRRDECPRGFLGSDCRMRIRNVVCAGRWSDNPPSGYSQCANNKRR